MANLCIKLKFFSFDYRPIQDAVDKGLDIVPGVEFSARHTMDGMFTFIDPKMTPILGYLPQELTGSSVYEHVLYDDIPGLVEGHRKALKVKEEVKVAPVKFRYLIFLICFLSIKQLNSNCFHLAQLLTRKRGEKSIFNNSY